MNYLIVIGGNALANGLQENTILFFLLILFLLLLGLVKVLDPFYFNDLFRSILDFNYINLILREGKLSWNLVNIFLDLVFLGSIAFYLFQYPSEMLADMDFWETLLWVTGIYLAHLLLYTAFTGVFYEGGYKRFFLYQLLIFNRVIGIILLPMVFLMTYFNLLPKTLTFNVLGILIILFLCYRFLRTLFQVQGKGRHGIIYNFFYLCVVEISPLIIVIDLITDVF